MTLPETTIYPLKARILTKETTIQENLSLYELQRYLIQPGNIKDIKDIARVINDYINNSNIILMAIILI